MRQKYLSDQRNVVLDFSRTRYLDATGTLAVIAEIDRTQRMGRSDLRFRTKLPEESDKETRIVRQTLDQIELLARTGHPPIYTDEERQEFDSTVINWRYATGTRVDDRPSDVLYEHEGRLAPALLKDMQIGLTEALLNSLHHAYQGSRDDGCREFRERRWWMFTQEEAGMLHVIACDLGIGIRRSLPRTWDRGLLKRITQFFDHECPDVRAIQAALILGESSTGEQHRGNGLPQIWNAVRSSNVGVVGIHTGNGHLSYNADVGTPVTGYFDSEFLGTIVAWTVPIESNLHE
ncbi:MULTISPECIES: hypothetical protein [Sphingobium]|uniref:hypothetical protein n=1 Tax=Sphingobium TaxID=165695 RepID=UPI0015EC3E40|nr:MULTISPECIES: hypothetical protein [Sphingobium]MCW2361640.1 hypothetical protein [Sphingobium sp. B10D3B]MCW2401681.1 hypothetical protein [Sphingobium sp. B10D7B]MCW2408661.1 hypothetical protein [Sphingobium xanthum]